MDIADQVDHLASLMDTLLYADEVPNTYGLTGQVAQTLRSLGMAISSKDTLAKLPAAVREKLGRELTRVEENRSVFAIPETWLIEEVDRQARTVRSRLGEGPFA